ncbi:MAG: transporter substrate-binding domain-containing protein [Firmicutes bacterium]|nr:transporter substrate-binding domain-containing protein [Bacillota bacterium]
MKRIISLMIALIVCGAVLCGCAKSDKKYVILSENFGDEQYAIAFRKGDYALCKAVQEALDAMYSDGKGAEISTKWFGSDVLLKGNDYASEMKEEADDDSLSYIKNKGTLVLGLDDAYPPMGFRDDSGEIVGIDIDLAREVCNRLGVELVLQPISWKAKDMELESKNIDCIWNGLSVNDDRVETYTLSKPYMTNAQVILVAEDSSIKAKADLEGKKVATQSGSAGLEVLQADDLASKITINEYDNYLAAYNDLKTGRIDAVVGDKTLLEYIITTSK